MNPPKIAYLAHDLSDAAVARRVQMLRQGGAEVKLAGFRRTNQPINAVEGVASLDLGQSFDQQLLRRAALLARCALANERLRGLLHGVDAVLARNLEMVVLAEAARFWTEQTIPMIYECLDIHRSVLGDKVPNRLLRWVDACVTRRSASLIVSSPAFLEHYFSRLKVMLPTVILAENKRLPGVQDDRPAIPVRPDEPPWRIGWFGILRCVRSFELLYELARNRPGKVDIVLRGRPGDPVRALIETKLPCINMRYDGPYSPSDLAALYENCDFAWTIDYSDEGLNSDWLLPNRLYEGGYYNVPALARAGTATASWLQTHGAGIVFYDLLRELTEFLDGLTSERMRDLRHATANIPNTNLIWTLEDSRDLVRRIVGRARPLGQTEHH